MVNYENGKVYCIRNRADDDKIVYVGSTVESLSTRMAKHRSSAKNPKFSNRKIYQIFNYHGIEQFYVELIKFYPCLSKNDLEAEEGRFIREHGTFNIGNQIIAGRTAKERYIDNADKMKQYRIDNAEKIKEHMKQWRFNNVEKVKEYQNQYREKYKEYQSQYNKQYYLRKEAEKAGQESSQ